MCWILWYIDKNSINLDLKNKFSSALLKLKSRGPDNTWTWKDKGVILWHSRLSIIDTSTNANQPFVIDKFICIFNWEIYNFKEIKIELEHKWYKFRTTSDTEVLLYSYIEWWELCTEKLDWMWAFCIYDIDKNILFLSRDRIWEKPLLYYFKNNIFIFWSEIPALLELIPNKCEINYEALSNFGVYNFRHIPSPYTPYKDVFKLEPWYNITLDLNTLELKKDKFFKISPIKINKDPVDQFDTIFKKAVERTCFADVPVWIFLSWWIDSSLIASCLKKRNIMTYSLWYDENDPEIIRAWKIAKYLKVPNKKIYFKEYLKNINFIDIIKNNIEYYWEPIDLVQIIYSDILLKEMKKDWIKVAVWWNWADELFYWYDWMNLLKFFNKFKKILDFSGISKIKWINKISSLLWSDNYRIKSNIYENILWNNEFINPNYRKFLYTNKFIEFWNEIFSKDIIDIFSWLWFRIENEHSITIVNDIAGSMNWMEVRTPFLNKDVIDFSCSLNSKYKVCSNPWNKYNKYILKKALEKYLPKDLIYNKKMWFWYWIPTNYLQKENKKIFDYCIKEIAPELKIFNMDNVIWKFEKLFNWEDNNIWIALDVLLIWLWHTKYKNYLIR